MCLYEQITDNGALYDRVILESCPRSVIRRTPPPPRQPLVHSTMLVRQIAPIVARVPKWLDIFGVAVATIRRPSSGDTERVSRQSGRPATRLSIAHAFSTPSCGGGWSRWTTRLFGSRRRPRKAPIVGPIQSEGLLIANAFEIHPVTEDPTPRSLLLLPRRPHNCRSPWLGVISGRPCNAREHLQSLVLYLYPNAIPKPGIHNTTIRVRIVMTQT